MAEMLINGTVMICVVLTVRRLTLGKISMRLRYALWLAVALRLMIPFHFGSSPYSIMSGVQQIGQHNGYMAKTVQTGAGSAYASGEQDWQAVDDTAGGMKEPGMEPDMQTGAEQVKARPGADGLTGAAVDGMAAGVEGSSDAGAVTRADEKNADRRYRLLPESISVLYMAVKTVWIIGMVATGGFMLARQARFIGYLHRVREQAQTNDLPEAWVQRLSEHGLRVWLVRGLPGPCMVGRGIYISPELYGDAEARFHILAHEYGHAVQRDDLWAAVRSVLCIVWWFWPPVWLAAYAAKQDSELACDERAVRLLGETQRFSYGRTLLALAHGGHDRSSAYGMVLSMNGSGRQIRQRISVIADTGRRSKIAAGIVALTVLLLCGCAYTGAQAVQEETESYAASPEAKQEAGVQAGTDGGTALERVQAAQGQEQADERGEATPQTERGEQPVCDIRPDEQAAYDKIEEEYMQAMRQKEEEYVQTMRQWEEELQENKEAIAKERERLEKEEAEIKEQLEQIRAQARQAEDNAFAQLLAESGDSMLETADYIDRMEYFDYLYNDGVCPMEDGGWYLLYRDEKYGIDFFGLYTEQYGSRGVKMLIDGDVNTLDIPWRSALYESGIEVFMIERTQDGLPRTFAFQMCEELTSEYACWNLYLVDRYDTGTIDFYAFDEEACQEQFRNMVDFRIDYERQKILLLYKGDVIKGGIDLLAYQDYTVEEAFWSGAGIRYYAADDDEYPIYFAANVGVKLAETQEIQYENLSRIVCPVSIGEWGDRSFTLGSPGVELR